jgi:hypothetical protein
MRFIEPQRDVPSTAQGFHLTLPHITRIGENTQGVFSDVLGGQVPGASGTGASRTELLDRSVPERQGDYRFGFSRDGLAPDIRFHSDDCDTLVRKLLQLMSLSFPDCFRDAAAPGPG